MDDVGDDIVRGMHHEILDGADVVADARHDVAGALVGEIVEVQRHQVAEALHADLQDEALPEQVHDVRARRAEHEAGDGQAQEAQRQGRQQGGVAGDDDLVEDVLEHQGRRQSARRGAEHGEHAEEQARPV